MTNNMLWMILAFTIGLGTGQLIGNSGATTETDTLIEKCTINGQIVLPCPTPTPTPPFGPAPGGQIQYQ